MRNKTPYPEIAYTRGPALLPKDVLVAWLDKLGAAKLVRLPVVVRFTRNKLGIEGGTAGELELTLADAGLGVSLHDHARRLCPERDRCTMHLVGRWNGVKNGVGSLFLWRVEGLAPAGVNYAEAGDAP